MHIIQINEKGYKFERKQGGAHGGSEERGGGNYVIIYYKLKMKEIIRCFKHFLNNVF